VDRSASYAARHCAKNIVAAGLAAECEVQVAYAIGVANPLAIYVDTRGTGRIPDGQLEKIATNLFDFRPKPMIQRLDLLRPIYKETARFGHFGRSLPNFTWERTDMVDSLRKAAKI
jgi:S-adenosylmethionine synthetase